MESFDEIYDSLGARIMREGVTQDDTMSIRAKYADGTPATTKSVEGVSFCITPSMGVPILESKRVPVKTPLIELEWIWQEMSNEVSWLNERGVRIWDEWCLPDGTIGKAYGWQLKNKRRLVEVDTKAQYGVMMNQVEYVIHELLNNPSSRRIMTTLWDVDDLFEMALEPCVWATHWTVHNGRLNLHVKQRSADFCLGLPFNVYQYHVLHAMVAKFTGLELGDMHWNIDNLHVYERHLEKLSVQLLAYNVHKVVTTQEVQPKPELQFPDDFNYDNFFANKLSEVKVVSYAPLGEYKYEIAI